MVVSYTPFREPLQEFRYIFFEQGTKAIIHVLNTDVDSATSRALVPMNVLEQHEANKHHNYQAISVFW